MGFWISIVIVLVAFNITTCLCCLLKRDTLTAVSSREEFTQLLKGLPGDFAALCHSIIPCLINPRVGDVALLLLQGVRGGAARPRPARTNLALREGVQG